MLGVRFPVQLRSVSQLGLVLRGGYQSFAGKQNTEQFANLFLVEESQEESHDDQRAQ